MRVRFPWFSTSQPPFGRVDYSILQRRRRGDRAATRRERRLHCRRDHLPRPGARRAAALVRAARGRADVIRRPKIVATIGPATAKDEAIAALLDAGANVVRINASHGTPEERAHWIETVRCAAERAELPVAVLVDLQGPRIRVGE